MSKEDGSVTFDQETAVAIFEFAEQTALLLGCLRNYRRCGFPIDLDGGLQLEPQVSDLLDQVRAKLRAAVGFEQG